MDSMEHICPEDWPGIARGFSSALKPGAPLYFTADYRSDEELQRCYTHGLEMGLPVVYGEIADEVETALRRLYENGEVLDQCIYHYAPPLAQITAWLEEAGLAVLETGGPDAEGYQHILARKRV
jgi:hypothetical protein